MPVPAARASNTVRRTPQKPPPPPKETTLEELNAQKPAVPAVVAPTEKPKAAILAEEPDEDEDLDDDDEDEDEDEDEDDDLDDDLDDDDEDEDDDDDEDEDDDLDDDDDDDDEEDEPEPVKKAPAKKPAKPKKASSRPPPRGVSLLGGGPRVGLAGGGALTGAARARALEQQEVSERTLDSIMAGFAFQNEEHEVVVSRTEPETDAFGTKVSGHLDTLKNPITIQEVKNKYGGGVFKILILARKANGGMEIKRNLKLEVAGDPKLPGGTPAFNNAWMRNGMHGGPSDDLTKQLLEQKDRDLVRVQKRAETLEQKVLEKDNRQESTATALLSAIVSKPDDTKAFLLEREKVEAIREEKREARRQQEEAEARRRDEERRREERELQRREEERRREEDNRRREEELRRKESEEKTMLAQMQMMMQTQQAQQAQQQAQMQMQMQMMSQQAQLQQQAADRQMTMMVTMMTQNAQQKDASTAQLIAVLTADKNNKKGGLSEQLGEIVNIKSALDSLSGGGGGESSTVEKLLEAAGPAIGGLLGGFVGGGGASAAPAAAAPVSNPAPVAPRVAPGSVAVVDLPARALTPAQRARALAPARKEKKEKVMKNIKEEAAKIDLPDNFVFPDENMKNPMDQAKLLASNIEIALRKDMTPQQVWEQVMSKFTSLLPMLKLVSKDQIFDTLAKSAPDDWQLVTIKGDRMVEDLLRIAKKA